MSYKVAASFVSISLRQLPTGNVKVKERSEKAKANTRQKKQLKFSYQRPKHQKCTTIMVSMSHNNAQNHRIRVIRLFQYAIIME